MKNKGYGLEFSEFDWFPEETEDSEEDYEGIEDLRPVSGLEKEEGTAFPESTEGLEFGDIEEDGLLWEKKEGLRESMRTAFSQVYWKMCGEELGEDSDFLADYVEELNKKCVVLQSGIGEAGFGEKEGTGNWTAAEARMKNCFSENGCVIVVISNDKWNVMLGKEETPFLDSGMRTLHVIGLRDGKIVVNDFMQENGGKFSVDAKDFCSLKGILLEVYK